MEPSEFHWILLGSRFLVRRFDSRLQHFDGFPDAPLAGLFFLGLVEPAAVLSLMRVTQAVKPRQKTLSCQRLFECQRDLYGSRHVILPKLDLDLVTRTRARLFPDGLEHRQHV